jgi:hypothetical protein
MQAKLKHISLYFTIKYTDVSVLYGCQTWTLNSDAMTQTTIPQPFHTMTKIRSITLVKTDKNFVRLL